MAFFVTAEIGGELIGPALRGVRALFKSADVIGELSPDIAKTFQFGRYTKETLEEPIVLSRYYDNINAFDKGRFMTNSISNFKALDRMGLALRPSWNAMTDVASWELPEGTTVFKGRAAMQFPWIGGKVESAPTTRF
jgi:hypothetical protein